MSLTATLTGLRAAIRQRRLTKTVSLTPEEIKQLNFYQFKKSTSLFFYERFGRTLIKIVDTPHYALAKALHRGDAQAIADADAYFSDYLQASWGNPPEDKIQEHLAGVRRTFNNYKNNGFSNSPVITRLPTDNDPYVVDGNHRTAIAAALEQSIKAHLLPINLAFLRYSKIPGFYGTDNKNMPYQSIVLAGHEVILGRRNDLAERLSMVPAEVIAGQSVLDVASNIGMSSLLARSLGARCCFGLEYSAQMVDLAMRLAMFSGSYPAVSFLQFDIDKDDLATDAVFDTAFMFSVHDHLKNPARLADVAESHTAKFVVFEGHPGRKRNDYAKFLDSGVFKKVSEIGRLHTSIFKADSSRILWLCEK